MIWVMELCPGAPIAFPTMTPRHIAIAAAFALIGSAHVGTAEVTVEKDVPFGDLPRQTLDIYTPDTVTQDTAVMIFFYGGAFTRGSKASVERMAESYANAGMLVVAPNYRLFPEVSFPLFVEDAAQAVSHVWRTLQDDGGQPRLIVVGGWSSGAYISALIAYDGRYLDAEDVPPDAIKGFIGLAGPYQGGLCGGRTCPDIFPKDTKADWPVLKFVDPSDPPMILIRGTRDRFVDISNLEDLAMAGEAAGLSVSTLVVQDGFHEDLMSDIAIPESPVREAVDAFLQSVLSP
ncbi:alpha/beta hydrolase [Psychromarinibacter sp. S121]|uniref:alpha/beta hydrolase n=1 Tax=Psychromarinibacter sp. S121 TaxID=3415127 RepID=UPI003C7A8E7A